MGLSIDRSLTIKNRYTEVVREIYSYAKFFKSTDAQINKRILERVYGQKSYQSLPHWCKSYIQGVRDTLHTQLYTYELEWKHFVKAKEGFVPSDCYMTREEVRAMIDKGYTDIYQDINRLSNGFSNHFWKGTDKPFGSVGRTDMKEG